MLASVRVKVLEASKALGRRLWFILSMCSVFIHVGQILAHCMENV